MHLIRHARAVALSAAAAVAIAACASKASSSADNKPAPDVPNVTGVHDASSRALGGVSDGEKGNEQTAQKERQYRTEAGRKVIRTGRVDIVVPAYDDARAKLDAIVAAAGGYIDSTQVTRGQGASSTAVVVVRVPTANFGTFIPQLRELGDVRSESTAGQDITDDYVDTAARLASAQALEKRLIELATARTGTIDQVLAVERELSRVRTEIESYQGHIKQWDDRVAMSTLTVDMSTKRPEIAAATAPSLGDRITSTFHASVATLRDFGSWLVVNGIAFLPWLLLIAPAFVILRKLSRRVKLPFAIAKQAAATPAPEQPAAPAA